MLARALRSKRVQTFVHKLHSSSGEVMVQSSKIALGFHDYYAELYNLGSDLSPGAQSVKLARTHNYLSTAGLPHLTHEQRTTMESPITLVEVKSTVRSLPNVKSPGPDGFTKAYYNKFLPL